MKQYGIKITVTEVRGKGCCEFGIKVGDSWVFDEKNVQFCSYAHTAVFPFVCAMKYGAVLPWEPDQNVAYACCPDPHNTVVFKIERS